jgi:protein phosphatase
MVGNGATLGANVASFTFAAGELLALCSDGVHKFVDSAAFAATLAAPGPLARRAQALIAQARRNGSADDATLMLVRHGGYGLPARAGNVAEATR